jgi:hypothetical protein
MTVAGSTPASASTTSSSGTTVTPTPADQSNPPGKTDRASRYGWPSSSSPLSTGAGAESSQWHRRRDGHLPATRTPDILDCLEAIEEIRSPQVELHLLGISRIDSMEKFAGYGVTSFDSTSPFKQAFMDDRDNFHTMTGTYVAIRVPQVDGNVALKRAILAGHVSQRDAIRTERECLRRLQQFDAGQAQVDDVIAVLADYEKIIDVKKSRLTDYRRTLEAAPWQHCSCGLCDRHGVEMITFRGTERNKRRGFHNLSVLAAKMHAISALARGRTADREAVVHQRSVCG